MVKKASPTSNGGQNGGPHLTSIGIIKFIVCLNDVMPPWQLRIQIKVATIPAACWSLLKGSASHAAILQQKLFMVINCASVLHDFHIFSHRVHMGHLNYLMGPVCKHFAHLCTWKNATFTLLKREEIISKLWAIFARYRVQNGASDRCKRLYCS